MDSVNNSKWMIYTLQLSEQTPLSSVLIQLSNTQDQQKFLLLSTEKETLLIKSAVEEIPIALEDTGSYICSFLVLEKTKE